MAHDPGPLAHRLMDRIDLLALALLLLIGGALSELVVAVFRLILGYKDRLRGVLVKQILKQLLWPVGG